MLWCRRPPPPPHRRREGRLCPAHSASTCLSITESEPAVPATQQSPLGGAEIRYPGLRFGALRLGALPCSVALRNGPLVGPLPALDRGSGNAVSFWKTPSAASAPGRLCGRLLSQVEQVTAERRTPGARRQTHPARLAPPRGSRNSSHQMLNRGSFGDGRPGSARLQISEPELSRGPLPCWGRGRSTWWGAVASLRLLPCWGGRSAGGTQLPAETVAQTLELLVGQRERPVPLSLPAQESHCSPNTPRSQAVGHGLGTENPYFLASHGSQSSPQQAHG